jgi:hypothetical protein
MSSFEYRLLVLAALSASGCGLISSDVTNFDLAAFDKSFTIDADNRWQIDPSLADALLATPCAQNASVCASAAMVACQMGCTGTCSAATDKCVLGLDVSLYQSIDIATERPELQTIHNEPVIKVSVDYSTYEITANTLDVATPVMKVYVAPMSVMNPKDPQAKELGEIPSVPAGATLAAQELAFTPTGRADLVATMNNYKTPFNIIIGATLTVEDGQPVPTGKLDATVHIKVHAGL